MTLTNYWWLLIWLFAGGGFLAVFFPRKNGMILGKVEQRWSMLAAVILAIPYVVWAAFRTDNFGDTATYRRAFLDAPSTLMELPAYLSKNTKDQGYTIMETLFKMIFGNSCTLFFLLIAVFQLACIVFVFRKYSSDFWISFFLFIISTDYLSWMHNGMRQFIAVVGIFACFGLMVKKKYVPLILLILLMSTIHGSALIMIPIVFIVQGRAWNKKTVFFICCIGVSILFIDRFTPLMDSLLAETQYNDLITNEIWVTDDGTSFLRILVYSMPALLSLVGKKYVDEADDPVINIAVNASACTAILYLLAGNSSGIYIGRLPIYTTLIGYILVPWIINRMFTQESAILVKIFMILAYFIFFYYQTHMTWGIL